VDGALVVRITTTQDDSMSTQSVEFFFDFGSPASYLAWTQLPALCAASGATLIYRPMLLGGVFQATGNASPVAVPAKGRYMLTDLARFAARYGVPLRFNPHFPINTLALMRGAVEGARPTTWIAPSTLPEGGPNAV